MCGRAAGARAVFCSPGCGTTASSVEQGSARRISTCPPVSVSVPTRRLELWTTTFQPPSPARGEQVRAADPGAVVVGRSRLDGRRRSARSGQLQAQRAGVLRGGGAGRGEARSSWRRPAARSCSSRQSAGGRVHSGSGVVPGRPARWSRGAGTPVHSHRPAGSRLRAGRRRRAGRAVAVLVGIWVSGSERGAGGGRRAGARPCPRGFAAASGAAVRVGRSWAARVRRTSTTCRREAERQHTGWSFDVAGWRPGCLSFGVELSVAGLGAVAGLERREFSSQAPAGGLPFAVPPQRGARILDVRNHTRRCPGEFQPDQPVSHREVSFTAVTRTFHIGLSRVQNMERSHTRSGRS